MPLTTEQKHALPMLLRAEVRKLSEASERHRADLDELATAHQEALQTPGGIAALVLDNVTTLDGADTCAAYCKAQRRAEAEDKLAAAQLVTAEAQAELDDLPE